MTNHRVLIANHDAVAANRFATSLRSVGFVVTLAFTSDEAIRLSADARPALLIVNPVMPALSGFEAAGHIARRIDCKVLFLTNLAGDADFAEMLGGMVRDGVHCAALPANVSNADLITFVRAELGPAILLTDAGKDEPREEAAPVARPATGAVVCPAEASQAESTAIPDEARNSASGDDIDLSAGFVPIESNDDTDPAPGMTRDEPYSPLFAIANSNLYQTNAFRVTGLQVTATAREIKRAYQEFSRNKELGRAWVSASFISPIVDPSDDEREAAFTQIDNPEQRLLQEFFWFWPDSDPDGAFDAVQAKDQDRLVKEWRRRSTVSDSEGVASHNLAVFNHLMALQTEGSKLLGQPVVAPDFWRDAFHYWHAVVENSRFWDCFIGRIRRVNDPRATPDLAGKIWASLPEAILYINAANAVRAAEAGDFAEAGRQRQLMYSSGLGEQNADRALSRALTPILQHLTLLCSQAKSQVETDPSRGIEVVRALNGAKSPLLKTLTCLVGADDVRRNAAHDEVASSIRGCLIGYVNKTEAWSAALPLFENCLALAQDPALQGTLSEDISVLHRNLDLQRREQSPPASATAAPHSGRADTGSTQRSPSVAHMLGFAIGRKWQRMPLFGKAMLALFAFALIVVLSVISRGSNSGSSDSSPSPSPASDSSPGYSSAPLSAESVPSANNDSEVETLKTEIEESKAQLKRLEEEIQAISSEMSEYTTSIDSDRSTLDQMKGENNAGIDVDQEQYEQIRHRHNQSVASYNRDAEHHNSLLRDYHNLLAETNDKVDKYNSMVKPR